MDTDHSMTEGEQPVTGSPEGIHNTQDAPLAA